MIEITPGPTEQNQKKILNRLRRAQGQLAAVITAVEAGGTVEELE